MQGREERGGVRGRGFQHTATARPTLRGGTTAVGSQHGTHQVLMVVQVGVPGWLQTCTQRGGGGRMG
jgi:hypothetical protein